MNNQNIHQNRRAKIQQKIQISNKSFNRTMSRSYQYNYYNRNVSQQSQPSNQSKKLPFPQEASQMIQSLKAQIKQKQSLLAELSVRIQEQERLLQEKQFALKQKELELNYIHKQNEELHDKIFQLNQRLHAERADLKHTIKQQISMLKEEFNFMIKENQTKTEIILQHKQREYKRKQEDLKSIIKDLSERANSNNGSFYYEQSHSNIIKTKNLPGSSIYKRNEEFYDNEEQKHSTANSNLRNSRESYRSSQVQHNKVLTSLRESIVGDNQDRTLKEKKPGVNSVSNLMNLRQGGTLQGESQFTGRFGFVKTPITSKLSVRRKIEDNKETSSRASSRPNIEEIISRSKRQLNERNKKSSMTELAKHYPPLNTTTQGCLVRKRIEDLDNSKSSTGYGIDHLDEKRKSEKLKEISSLKMKVNMLKTELKEQISFCQHKE